MCRADRKAGGDEQSGRQHNGALHGSSSGYGKVRRNVVDHTRELGGHKAKGGLAEMIDHATVGHGGLGRLIDNAKCAPSSGAGASEHRYLQDAAAVQPRESVFEKRVPSAVWT